MSVFYDKILQKINKIREEMKSVAQQAKQLREDVQFAKDSAEAEKIRAALLSKQEEKGR